MRRREKDDYPGVSWWRDSPPDWSALTFMRRAGEGESTTDLVFGGHNLIAENGKVLAEAPRFENTVIYGDVDGAAADGGAQKDEFLPLRRIKGVIR